HAAGGAAGMWDQAMARWMTAPAGRTPFLPALALLVFAVCGATSSAFACVVGTGTAASCTEAALDACLPGGGSFDGTAIFSCGGLAAVAVTHAKNITADTAIDGGGGVTISGVLVFTHRTVAGEKPTHPHPQNRNPHTLAQP